MAITTLDEKTALVVIDLQKGIVALPTAHPIAGVVERAATLAEAFRAHGLPVVLVNVAGVPAGRTEQAPRIREFPAGWTDFVAELLPEPQDHTVTKRTAGAFVNTDLEAWLKGEGVTQVVIVGVATSMGVEATARHARDLGFNVTLALDAMTDTNLEAHASCIAHVFPRLAETGTTRDILDHLARRGT
ncbi:cysteine hydrolase family protein [Mesorhizobium sp.]|jgi:nicotinamidase-related amidase|uniref:cysteine hydrolase family protein n=1 Tax=Mesorhizobium sp. TaxID=1871066 RepID=UPI0035668AC5